jgi:hypothetical protein
VAVPIIVDADTGYGNPINVIRTVRDFERPGVAGCSCPRPPQSRSFLATLRSAGEPGGVLSDLPTIEAFVNTLGRAELRELEARFGDQPL